ncbi:MAG: glycine cleavage system protein GcvH [Polyangiales bacterium]
MSDNPRDLRYTNDHEWARADGANVRVGITKHAVEALGDITLVNLDVKVGATLTAGKPFGTVESVKAVSDLFAPISGKLVAVNGALNDKPETVNEDPYGEGWMVVIEPAAGESLDKLLSADAYDALLGTL